MTLCEPHLQRGFRVASARVISGTAMCAACIAGKPVREIEAARAARGKLPLSARQRRSEASKRAWADPAARQRMTEAIKRAWADPAARQRRSEA
ncbi:MAG: hypothetical protein ACRD4R_06835 [Candidatus Acidiferrales bacterium]